MRLGNWPLTRGLGRCVFGTRAGEGNLDFTGLEEICLEFKEFKLEIFIPESHLPVLRSALQSVHAGTLGNYDSCLAYSRVIGSWRPLHGSHPYLGTEAEVSEEEEIKVEANILAGNLEKTLNAIYEVHPYEEPLVNVIPLLNRKKAQK